MVSKTTAARAGQPITWTNGALAGGAAFWLAHRPGPEARMDDRRRSKRITPGDDLVGTVKATVPARVVDISPFGAQVEVPSALRPMVECDVTLPLERGPLRVRARVQRCRAAAMDGTVSSGPTLMYRAGLEFVAVEPAISEILQKEFGPQPEPGPTAPAATPRRTGPIKIRIDSKFLRDLE